MLDNAAVQRRYDRLAGVFEFLERLMGKGKMAVWRQRQWELMSGPRVLEVGVGVGASFPFYPSGLDITAIDLSPAMLARAEKRARRDSIAVHLHVMDVQHLPFADSSFDCVVAACVFCSVPDPMAGLTELLRVLRPGGQAIFLEHVRSQQPLLGAVMDGLNPLVRALVGANINRPTLVSIAGAGFAIQTREALDPFGVFWLVVARKPIPLK